MGKGEATHAGSQRRVLWSLEDYNEDVNAAADVFTMTAGAVALESALPSTVRVVGEGYVSALYDHTELAVAVGGDGLATFFENVEVCSAPGLGWRSGNGFVYSHASKHIRFVSCRFALRTAQQGIGVDNLPGRT